MSVVPASSTRVRAPRVLAGTASASAGSSLPSAAPHVPSHTASQSGWSGLCAVALGMASLGAGVVHLAVVGEHLAWWPLIGVLIAVLGGAQLALGLAALRLPASGRAGRRLLVWSGALAGGAVAGWLLVTLQRLPGGPAELRLPGAADAAALALCFAVLLLSCLAQRAPDVRAQLPAWLLLLLLFAWALLIGWLCTAGLAGSEAGTHAVPHGGHH